MGFRFSRVACLIVVAGLGDWAYVLRRVVMEFDRGRRV